MSEEQPLLTVRNLKQYYPVRSGLLRRVTGQVKAVDGVSLDVHDGETVGLVGESGCGKSTTARTILGLERPTDGEVRFDGERITDLARHEEAKFRRRAQIVFQDPGSAFDPRMTVGESLREPLEVHGLDDPERKDEIVVDLLERMGLSAADVGRYPHEFSDGQKQRLALARALVLNPDLLVADEPVSALDVSVQAEILSLLESLQRELDLSILLISHDLGVVREICDRVGVMYLGKIVERGPTAELFETPQHPYTEALIEAIPDPDPESTGEAAPLTGDVPDPSDPPSGCSFYTRCPRVIAPDEYELADGTFRSVLDLRLAIEHTDVQPETFDGETAVRDAFDIPAELADDRAESAVTAGIEALLDGELAAAADRLETEFTTVCEREEPTLQSVDGDHEAACHLHDETPAVSRADTRDP